MYLMGKTGMGKTSLLLNMAVSDIQKGHGMAFVDPHGDVSERLLHYIPESRLDDVIYFNPADLEYPIGFNPLDKVDFSQRHIVTDGLIGVFQKIWADSWGPRLAYILRNCILTLLEYPDTTLLDIMRILVDKNWRTQVVRHIEDPVVKSFWVNEFNNYTEQMMREAISPIQNKVGQFTSSPLIRNIIGQKESTIDLREIMDNRKILLLNLSKGAIGEGGSQLIGAMMITKMQLAAMSRVEIPEKERRDFFAYIDEFQNFSTDSFAEILSEARKYRLGLILAHQYIHQLSENVQAAVFGNVGTTILFRVGGHDSEVMEKEFGPRLTAQDLVNLPKWKIYVKLMIDGATSQPFSANTIPDPEPPELDLSEQVIEISRKRYGIHRDYVGMAKADQEQQEQEAEAEKKKNTQNQEKRASDSQEPSSKNRHSKNQASERNTDRQSQKKDSRHKNNAQSSQSQRKSKSEEKRSGSTQSSARSNRSQSNREQTDSSDLSSNPSAHTGKAEQSKSAEPQKDKEKESLSNEQPSQAEPAQSQTEQAPTNDQESDEHTQGSEITQTESTGESEHSSERGGKTEETSSQEEIYNPILAKKLKERYARSTTPLGETEYLLKAHIQDQINEPPEERLSFEELLHQLVLEVKSDFEVTDLPSSEEMEERKIAASGEENEEKQSQPEKPEKEEPSEGADDTEASEPVSQEQDTEEDKTSSGTQEPPSDQKSSSESIPENPEEQIRQSEPEQSDSPSEMDVDIDIDLEKESEEAGSESIESPEGGSQEQESSSSLEESISSSLDDVLSEIENSENSSEEQPSSRQKGRGKRIQPGQVVKFRK